MEWIVRVCRIPGYRMWMCERSSLLHALLSNRSLTDLCEWRLNVRCNPCHFSSPLFCLKMWIKSTFQRCWSFSSGIIIFSRNLCLIQERQLSLPWLSICVFFTSWLPLLKWFSIYCDLRRDRFVLLEYCGLFHFGLLLHWPLCKYFF